MLKLWRVIVVVIVLIAVLLCSTSSNRTCQVSNTTCQDFPSADRRQCSRTWFFSKNISKKCECGPSLDSSVKCSPATKKVWLDLLYCMTYNSATKSTALGYCIFSSLRKSELGSNYVLLPENLTDLNDAMCGKANREGLLCSKCKPGYGPAVLSYKKTCAKCSDSQYGWLLYFLYACVPTVIFFFIFALCQVRTTSAQMNFFVFACQIVGDCLVFYPQELYFSSTAYTTIVGIVATFFTLWNLEFFRLLVPPFCISENLSTLQVLCMDYIVAFLPLLVTVIMYICIQQHARGCRILVYLWQPFGYCLLPLMKRFNWNPAESIVHTFASFLLLSSTKFLSISASLVYTTWFHVNNSTTGVWRTHTNVLYYDPSVVLLSKGHLPYALLAICVSTTFVVLPCLLLVVYPLRLFQQCLNCCGIKWHAIHAFADAFNGCYKDGTNGTRDYRCFAGFYLIQRILIFLTNVFPFSNRYRIGELWLIISSFIFIFVSPYKNRVFNFFDSFGLMIVVMRFTVGGKNLFNVICICYCVIYFSVYVCCKIIFKLNFQCFQKLKMFADKMAQSSNNPHSLERSRETCDVEANLPDRMVNPEGYRQLTEADENEPLTDSNTRSVPTYGIIQ